MFQTCPRVTEVSSAPATRVVASDYSCPSFFIRDHPQWKLRAATQIGSPIRLSASDRGDARLTTCSQGASTCLQNPFRVPSTVSGLEYLTSTVHRDPAKSKLVGINLGCQPTPTAIQESTARFGRVTARTRGLPLDRRATGTFTASGLLSWPHRSAAPVCLAAMPWPMIATMNGAERKASGAILVSERQRPAHRVHVHLVERRLRERAAAVGVADQKRPAADRPGEAAGRDGELPGAAGYFPS